MLLLASNLFLPAGSLVVDCNSTKATLSTLDLCVSYADPSVYVLFPYPGSPGVKVIVRCPNGALCLQLPPSPMWLNHSL